MPACPAPQLLERLLAEALPEAEGTALEAHIEQCPACQDRLERLTASARWTNGKLSKEEAARLPAIAAKFDQLDKDKKGYLTLEEFAAGYTAAK